MYERPLRPDELYHYGVKGMHWGIRRYQNYDGTLKNLKRIKNTMPSPNAGGGDVQDEKRKEDKHKGLTDEQKQKLKTGLMIAGGILAVSGGVYLYNKYGKTMDTFEYKESPDLRSHITSIKVGANVDPSKLSTESKTLSKKTVLQRISSEPAEKYVDKGKGIYASYLKEDNDLYVQEMPKMIKKWKRDRVIRTDSNDAYIHRMTLKRDVKIASERDLFDAFKAASGKSEVSDVSYKRFMEQLKSLSDGDKPIYDKMVKTLQSKGYDGIVDPNDAVEGWAKAPLFLFDAASVIADSESKKMVNISNKLRPRKHTVWKIK